MNSCEFPRYCYFIWFCQMGQNLEHFSMPFSTAKLIGVLPSLTRELGFVWKMRKIWQFLYAHSKLLLKKWGVHQNVPQIDLITQDFVSNEPRFYTHLLLSSTQKKLLISSLIEMAQGTFVKAQITNIENKSHAHLEGWRFRDRKDLQILSDCYLQNGMIFDFNIGNLGLSHFS